MTSLVDESVCLAFIYLLNVTVLDENHNDSEEALSPSKRTKNVTEVTSPSVLLNRMPLSPRKDLNVSSPVHQSQNRSSAPNTLPKTSLQSAERPLLRTRRNLASSFASLTSDSSSFSPQHCHSIDEIRDKIRTRSGKHGETKRPDVVSKTATPSAVTCTTPSKSRKKVGTPSERVTEPTQLTRTPSKTAETPSKPELATMRLIKDSGSMLFTAVYI